MLCMFFLIFSCTKAGYYGGYKVIISEKLALYLYDVKVISISTEDNKESVLIKSTAHRIVTEKAIADSLSWQLESRGFKHRCKNYNELHVFGGPLYRVGLSTDYGLAVLITAKPKKEVNVYEINIEYIRDRLFLPC